MSLLTTGPVGVSDRIGYTDIDLVHRSVSLSVVLLPVASCMKEEETVKVKVKLV